MANAPYVADRLSHPQPPNPPIGYGKIHRVTSAPATAFGDNGDLAINTISGAIYEKFGDSWTEFTGGGGGGGGTLQVLVGTIDDPNGTFTPDDPTKGAVYYKKDDVDTKFWTWNTTSLAWNQFIA